MGAQDGAEHFDTMLRQAALFISQRKYESAAALLEPNVKPLRRSGAEGCFFPVLSNLGVCYLEQGRLGEARSCLEEALAIARKLDNSHAIAAALHELSQVYWKQGELEKAIHTCTESLRIHSQHGSEGTMALYTLSILYQESGRFDKAEEALELVKEGCQARRDLQGLSRALHELGLVAGRTNAFPKAAAYLLQAIRLKRQIGDEHGIQMVLQNLRSILRSSPRAVLEPKMRDLLRDITRETGEPFAW